LDKKGYLEHALVERHGGSLERVPHGRELGDMNGIRNRRLCELIAEVFVRWNNQGPAIGLMAQIGVGVEGACLVGGGGDTEVDDALRKTSSRRKNVLSAKEELVGLKDEWTITFELVAHLSEAASQARLRPRPRRRCRCRSRRCP